jgi:hypothetical protein
MSLSVVSVQTEEACTREVQNMFLQPRNEMVEKERLPVPCLSGYS